MANGKAELTLEHLRLARRALHYMWDTEGVDPEHVSEVDGIFVAAIAEAKMRERNPEPRQAWYATIDAGEPDPSTDEWVFFPHRGDGGEWGWKSGATVLYYCEIGPLPEMEKETKYGERKS